MSESDEYWLACLSEACWKRLLQGPNQTITSHDTWHAPRYAAVKLSYVEQELYGHHPADPCQLHAVQKKA